MDAKYLGGLLLVLCLVADVNAQEPEPEPQPTLRQRAWNAADWAYDYLVERASYEYNSVVNLLEFAQDGFSGELVKVIDWLTAPVTSRIIHFLDYIGMTETRLLRIDISASPIIYHLKIINLWAPLSEFIGYVAYFAIFIAAWIPIKVVVKYLAPGLG